jgi:hypothetical protein
MSYHYLFADDEGNPIARVKYHFTPITRATWTGPAEGGELVIDECIPPGFEIGKIEDLELRHHAAYMDRDEAESRDCDSLKDHPMPNTHPVRWGTRG